MRVYIRHGRELNYCSRGIRQFCKIYGIDIATFLREGIDAEELAKLNSDYANNMIELAKKECADNGRRG